MTPVQYRQCMTLLGLTHYTAGEVLGVSWRQSYRWARGDTPVPRPVALVLLTCIGTNTFPEQLGADADQTLKALGRERASSAA